MICAAAPVSAQPPEPPPTFLDHPAGNRYWIGGQINLIGQADGDFHSPYSGPNSFRPGPETELSRVLTLFTALRLGDTWEVHFDLESAGGRGLSEAFGLAGFTNLDVVRNPSLGSAPYIARAMVRKVFALSSEVADVRPGPFGVAARLPAKRIEVRAGKFGMVDFFDLNAVGGDSHLQFTNWTVDNNGAYDYAADTRGYTIGAIVEYVAPTWSLRGAVAMMPKVANGIDLDSDLARARGQNVEVEIRRIPRVTVRGLAYVNRANMGDYREAIQAYERGEDPAPDITAHRHQGAIKYGFGANMDAEVRGLVRVYARTGWNEGEHESFAYTEVNNTLAAGADIAGAPWHRAGDRAGAALVTNGISSEHQEYLRLGGLGFLLGDGRLNYGREQILETYYTAHVWRGLFASAGFQLIANPGYNRDRGPVAVGSARVHLDF